MLMGGSLPKFASCTEFQYRLAEVVANFVVWLIVMREFSNSRST